MKYIIRILIVLVVTFITTSILYNLFEKGQSTYRNNYEKYKEMFADSKKYDVVLIGSSRTHRNFDPIICDSVTGLSFYNAGISGAGFYEIYTAFSSFFKVHSPVSKYIIYNIDDLNFKSDKKFFNPTLYFNFLDNSEI